MRNIISITLLMLFIILPLSCKKSEKVEEIVKLYVDRQDSTLIFEIDSTLLSEDIEKGYLSIGDMAPFNTYTLIGSMSYKRDYNIDIFMLPSPDSACIVMSEMFNRDDKGNSLWRMVDSKNIYFPIGAEIGWPGSVVRNDVVDYSLIALMPEDKDWVDTEVYDNLLGVWQLNIDEKTIKSISPKNVSCINESYGVH